MSTFLYILQYFWNQVQKIYTLVALDVISWKSVFDSCHSEYPFVVIQTRLPSYASVFANLKAMNLRSNNVGHMQYIHAKCRNNRKLQNARVEYAILESKYPTLVILNKKSLFEM